METLLRIAVLALLAGMAQFAVRRAWRAATRDKRRAFLVQKLTKRFQFLFVTQKHICVLANPLFATAVVFALRAKSVKAIFGTKFVFWLFGAKATGENSGTKVMFPDP